MNTNQHTLHRLHDPASFTWLAGLTPEMEGSAASRAVCFGMDTTYLHSDMLAHYPTHLVLAIPPLNAPPVEYGFACTSKGQRWFCFVVVRKNASKSAALIFEVSPYALMFPAHGLRETARELEALAIPLALLRGKLLEHRFMPASTLNTYTNGMLARACGMVTVRQRPGTAKGVLFITLEDETGNVNVIIWPSLVERQRREVLSAPLLGVYGVWQQEGVVRHLVAKRLVDMSHLLGRLPTISRDFC